MLFCFITEFKKTILSKLNFVLRKLEDIDTKIVLLNEQNNSVPEEVNDEEMSVLPLQNIDELKNFERRLLEENGFFRKMVCCSSLTAT